MLPGLSRKRSRRCWSRRSTSIASPSDVPLLDHCTVPLSFRFRIHSSRADLDHPVHRHFLWGRQLDAYLGGWGEVLQELGELIVSEEEEKEREVGEG